MLATHPMAKLVKAVCPEFDTETRSVVESLDQTSWWKVIDAQNTLRVPPLKILRTRPDLLERFSEAVQAFSIYRRGSSEYNWDNLQHEHCEPEEFACVIRNLEPGLRVACDIESRRVEWEDNRVLAIGICYDSEFAVTVHNLPERDELPEFWETLQDFFNRTDLTFVWQNGKFDCTRLEYLLNIDARVDEDTMLQHYVRINEKQGTHGLKEMAQLYLQAPAWEDELDRVRDQWCRQNKVAKKEFMYDYFETTTLLPYLAMDCVATYRLFDKFNELAAPESEFIYRKLIEASNVYGRMELAGIRIDVEYLNELEYLLDVEIAKDQKELDKVAALIWDPVQYALETGARSIPKGGFNMRSPKQLKWMLEKMLGRPVPNTTADTIAHLIEEVESGQIDSPVAADFLKSMGALRKNSKYLETYAQGTRDALCRDLRVRSTFNLHGTETGRLSSSKPNLQNIPRNKLIRNLYVSSPGYKLVQLDYSQAELRVLAVLSGDEFMQQAYRDGKDFHDAVSIDMFGPDFDKEQRNLAKTINFGIAYGRGPSSLSEKFGVPMAEAREIIEKWFKPMPKVREYINNRRRMPQRGEPCVTLLGRTRHFLITNENLNHVQNEYINTPIQSLASDLTMISLLEIDKWLRKEDLDARIVLTVHDSIILEVADDEQLIEKISNKCADIMATVPQDLIPNCPVPFKADVSVGTKWGELE